MDTQLRDELKRELRTLIKPHRTATKKPPFTAEELVVIAIVLHPLRQPTQASIQSFIIQNFAYYADLALACTPFARGPFWNPWKSCAQLTETFQNECDMVYRQYEVPISMTLSDEYDDEVGEEEEEEEEEEEPLLMARNWYSVSTAAARIFLKDRLPQQVKLEEPQKPFPFMRLPAELRDRVYKMVLLLPKSGVCVKVKSEVLNPITQTFTGVAHRIPAELSVMRKEHDSFAHLHVDNMFAAYHPEDEGWEGDWEDVQLCRPAAQHLALLQVSKQIFAEALPLFYSTNTFIFPRVKYLKWFLEATPPARRQHIEHIGFHFFESDSGWATDAFRMLKHIKHLRSLDIFVRENDWKAEQKPRSGLPKYPDLLKIPGVFTLRSIRGLEVVNFHGGSGIYDALVPEMTSTKKKASASRKRKAKAVTGDLAAAEDEDEAEDEYTEANAAPARKKARKNIGPVENAVEDEGTEDDAAPATTTKADKRTSYRKHLLDGLGL